VYCLANEQNCSISELWDGTNLKITFRRCFDHHLMLQWFEILQIAQTLHLSSESDALVWKFEPSGVFSVKSMYAMIIFRGIVPVSCAFCLEAQTSTKNSFFFSGWLFITKI
jgi:hypothetical protein